jgi:glycosyltransferase involved in cell wall biosynthesis
MKILHLIDSSGLYGAEIMLLNLISAQMASGHLRPVLCSMGLEKEGEKEIEVEAGKRGIPVISWRCREREFGAGRRLLQLARQEQVSVLHSHGYKANILVGLLPRVMRRPMALVSTLHGWTCQQRYSKLWWYELLDKISLRNMDAVVRVTSSPSPQWQGFLLKGLRTSVIENGIPPLSFAAPPPDEILDFGRGSYTIVTVGRLSPEKGHDCLIEAVARLSQEKNDCRLVIIGEGRLRPALEERIRRHGLEDRVLLAGYRQEAYRYFPFFDAFVLPSRTEGLPITVLEAMQAGIPIVASRVGEVPAVLGEGAGGILIEPGNPDLLREKLRYLMEHPEAGNQLAATARRTVLAEYSAAIMAAKYENLYLRCVKTGEIAPAGAERERGVSQQGQSRHRGA